MFITFFFCIFVKWKSVKVKENMDISIPEEIFGIKKWEATVVSNYSVASFIKEFIVELPEDMDYKAGGYIQIEIPKCIVPFKDIDIEAHPEEHPGEPEARHPPRVPQDPPSGGQKPRCQGQLSPLLRDHSARRRNPRGARLPRRQTLQKSHG